MSSRKSEKLPAFPKLRWVFLVLAVWLVCGLVPIGLVHLSGSVSLANGSETAIAGTIGDAFGLANSLFSGAALLFVIWSIRLQQQEIEFARDEWRENTESQEKQAKMMKESASLTAINHIYQHYSGSYGSDDNTGILRAVAAGHRRWAIRKSFGSIDSVFDPDRVEQVQREESQLAELLMVPEHTESYMRKVATRTASLLVDERAGEAFRRSLWSIYDLLRASPNELCDSESALFDAFSRRAEEAATAWRAQNG